MSEKPTAGFIAQEFDSLQTEEQVEWLNLVLKDNPNKWEATPGNLLPVMVKAIQDLKKEKDELKDKLDEISFANKQLAEQNQSLAQEISFFKEQFQIQLKEIMTGLNSDTKEKTKVSMEN